jgi:putative SOS response-associated peptidase YedK
MLCMAFRSTARRRRSARRIAPFHDRQPVILDPGAYGAWLDPTTPVDAAKGLLLANLDDDLQFHRVSRTVNSVKNQGSDCIDPINPF